jgi:hypothetical protein
MLSHASGAAQQARAAARAKLAGIAVPRPGLTVSHVDAWAERLAPQHKSAPGYDTLLHGAESGGLSALKDLGDLVGLGPLYGDPSFGQTWGGIADLAEPWHWKTFTQSWEGPGKGLLAWNEWKSDPARAEGQVVFNAATLGLAGLLKLGDAGEVAADTGKTAESAGDLSRLAEAHRVQDIVNPGGNPIGVPGSLGVRVVTSQKELHQLFDQIKTELGRPPDRVIETPKGPIDQYDLGDGETVQYRAFSKSGGDTIDIDIEDEPIEKIHVKS